MKFTRPILTALLGLSLAACSESDTVIALNVTYGEGLSEVDTLRVVLEQGSNSEEVVLDAPRNADDSLDTEFFHRITLPDSWVDGEATVEVEARNDNNLVIVSDETTVNVREGGGVAAFIELAVEPPPVEDSGLPEDSGTSDAGEEDSGAPADEDGGSDLDGAVANDGAVTVEDGSVILPDGAVLPDAALPDLLPDGAVLLPDGAVLPDLLPDGAVLLPDGAVVLPDAAL